MKCKNCGAEIPNDAAACPYCEMAIVSEQPIMEPVVTQQQGQIITNELMGKKYDFISTRGMNMASLIDSKVSSVVEVDEDRLRISVKPKRMNVSPVVMLEDILAIELSKKITPYHIGSAIICLFAVLIFPGFLLLAILDLWLGTNTKITISQRNGTNIVMYSSNKANAEAFKEDMKKIAKIQ